MYNIQLIGLALLDCYKITLAFWVCVSQLYSEHLCLLLVTGRVPPGEASDVQSMPYKTPMVPVPPEHVSSLIARSWSAG